MTQEVKILSNFPCQCSLAWIYDSWFHFRAVIYEVHYGRNLPGKVYGTWRRQVYREAWEGVHIHENSKRVWKG